MTSHLRFNESEGGEERESKWLRDLSRWSLEMRYWSEDRQSCQKTEKKTIRMNRLQLDRQMNEWGERGGKKGKISLSYYPHCIPTRSFITFPPIICYSHTKTYSNLHLWYFKSMQIQYIKLCPNRPSFLGDLQILCVACWCLIIPLFLFSNPSFPLIYCPLPVRHHTYVCSSGTITYAWKTLYSTTLTHQYNHPTAVSLAI